MGGTISDNTLAGSTEAWEFTCYDPATYRAYVEVGYVLAIGHAAKPGIMIATISKGRAGRSTLDDTTGDLYGPGVSIGGGSGTYLITVHRTTAGLLNIVLIFFA